MRRRESDQAPAGRGLTIHSSRTRFAGRLNSGVSAQLKGRIIVKKLLLLPFLLFASHSRAAGPGPAPVIEVPVQETCKEHITATPRLSLNDWPKKARGKDINAYVVISYILDGSGKAKNLEVTDSKPKGLFDNATLSILKRTDFSVGVQAQACTYVRTYGAVRRAEL